VHQIEHYTIVTD